ANTRSGRLQVRLMVAHGPSAVFSQVQLLFEGSPRNTGPAAPVWVESHAPYCSGSKVLTGPVTHAFERPLDVIDRVSERESQVTLTPGSEGCAGKAGYSRLGQEGARQGPRVAPSAGNVRESVEGPLWLGAPKSRNPVQAIDYDPAPAAKLLQHAVDRRLVAAQGLNGCNLGEARRDRKS